MLNCLKTKCFGLVQQTKIFWFTSTPNKYCILVFPTEIWKKNPNKPKTKPDIFMWKILILWKQHFLSKNHSDEKFLTRFNIMCSSITLTLFCCSAFFSVETQTRVLSPRTLQKIVLNRVKLQSYSMQTPEFRHHPVSLRESTIQVLHEQTCNLSINI